MQNGYRYNQDVPRIEDEDFEDMPSIDDSIRRDDEYMSSQNNDARGNTIISNRSFNVKLIKDIADSADKGERRITEIF